MRNAGPASLTLLPSEGHPAWRGLRDFAFALGEDAAGLAHLWAPAGVAMTLDLPPDVDDVLQVPRTVR